MKNYLKNLSLSVDLILIFAFTSVSILIFLVARSLFLYQPTYLSLPFESTVFDADWTTQTSSESFNAVARNTGLPNAIQLLNADQVFLSEFASLKSKIPASDLASKTVTLQKIESQVYPVLILRFRNITDLKELQSLPGFVHFTDKDLLFISTNKTPLLALKKSKRTLQLNPSVQEVISNLPKQNIADFYLNHNLVTPDLISGFMSGFEDLNTTLNITAGTLKENNLGLVLSTFTSPKKGLKFPFTRQKYLAKIPSSIPNDQLFFLGGIDASSRILNLTKNLPQFSNDTNLVTNKIFSILNTYNLSSNSLLFLTEIFKNEFAITLNSKMQTSLIYKDFNRLNNGLLEKELNGLTAFFNPKKISYLLEDGQVASQLVPNELIKGTAINSNLKQFPLAELNTKFYWGTQESRQYAFLSQTFNPFETDTKLFSENLFFKQASQVLLPLADELIYLNKNLSYSFLKDKLDLRDVPNTLTATNFFTDGIQTVTIMQW
jgi:hypothetical protein